MAPDDDSTKPETVPGMLALGIQQVCTKLGVSHATIYNMMKTGEFPRPFKIGRRSMWYVEEVDDYLRARMAERDGAPVTRPERVPATAPVEPIANAAEARREYQRKWRQKRRARAAEQIRHDDEYRLRSAQESDLRNQIAELQQKLLRLEAERKLDQVQPLVHPKRGQSDHQINLTAGEAARRLRLEPKTLANWRNYGIGPPFKKFGSRVVYPLASLIEWERKQNGGNK